MQFQMNPDPLFIRPDILSDPPLPQGLHRVNPRSIKGRAWWDIVRQEAYEGNNYCCWSCGVHISNALFYYRLEAHERFVYKYNFRSGVAKLREVAALCHACHNFIHIGRLRALAKRGIVSREKYTEIFNHGMVLYRKYGLQQQTHPRRVEKYNWNAWTLQFEGKEYKSPFKTKMQYVAFFNQINRSEQNG